MKFVPLGEWYSRQDDLTVEEKEATEVDAFLTLAAAFLVAHLRENRVAYITHKEYEIVAEILKDDVKDVVGSFEFSRTFDGFVLRTKRG